MTEKKRFYFVLASRRAGRRKIPYEKPVTKLGKYGESTDNPRTTWMFVIVPHGYYIHKESFEIGGCFLFETLV